MEKKKGVDITTIIIVVLLIICLGLGTYIFMNRDEMFGKKDTQPQSTEKTNKEETGEEEDNYKFDASKVVNGEDRTYTDVSGKLLKNEDTTSYESSFDGVSYSGAGKEVSVEIQWSKLKKHNFCSYGETEKLCSSKKDSDVTKRQMTFNKEIVDIVGAGMGQDISSSYVLFIREDGTINYVNEFNSLLNQKYEINFVNGIFGVVKVYHADVSTEFGGYSTTLIQTKDDKIYDLSDSKYIKDI